MKNLLWIKAANRAFRKFTVEAQKKILTVLKIAGEGEPADIAKPMRGQGQAKSRMSPFPRSSLKLFYCTKLESLVGIQGANNLQTLWFETCKKLTALQPLSELPILTKVYSNNWGRIQSLLPLASCKNLHELFFIEDTNIVDGKMNIFLHLLALKTMWFADRRHYSYTREEIKKILEARNL